MQEIFRKELFKATYDKPTGYLGYIYQYTPSWKTDDEKDEYLFFDIGNIFLKAQISTKEWKIFPINSVVITTAKPS